MFVLKKHRFKSEEDKELSANDENPVFADKVNLKAKWRYSKEDN